MLPDRGTRLVRVKTVATDIDLFPLPDGRTFYDETCQHWTRWQICRVNGYRTL